MKVYIAGPISNNPNYEADFAKAEADWKAKGHAVINPVKNLGFDYKDYIDMGLCELMKCDAIVMLNGWQRSKGARLEFTYAEAVGMKIFKQEEIITIPTTAKCIKKIVWAPACHKCGTTKHMMTYERDADHITFECTNCGNEVVKRIK